MKHGGGGGGRRRRRWQNNITIKNCHIKHIRSQRRAIWCTAPTKNLHNIEDRYSEELDVESPWLETIHFQKCMYM